MTKILSLRFLWPTLVLILIAATIALSPHNPSINKKTVRVCVIGGMTMTGLWQQLSQRFEEQSGYQVKLVATGPRQLISAPFRRGEADFLVMHSGDITTDLVVNGYGINMRPCARNDLIIIGPAEDPAGIRGLKDGAEALRRIANTESTFVDVNSNGARELGHTLWQRAGLRPAGDWFIQDEASRSSTILRYAAKHNAYAIFGRMPVTQGKVDSYGLQILVDQDKTMRRPYIMMEANSERFPEVNQQGSRLLANFILTEESQRFMASYGKDKNGGYPFFYPVWPNQEIAKGRD